MLENPTCGGTTCDLGASLHPRCVVCESENPWSLGLRFAPEAEGGVWATFWSHEHLQGYEGLLHGGVTASVLDAAMTHCLFHHGRHAVTATLSLRYLEPVPLGKSLQVRARPVTMGSAACRLEARLECEGRTLVTAEALFMPPRRPAS